MTHVHNLALRGLPLKIGIKYPWVKQFRTVLGIWAIVVVMSQKSSMSIFECTTDKYPCKYFNQKYVLGKTAFEKTSLSLSIYRKMVGSIPLTYDMLFPRLLGGKKFLLFTSELASRYVHTMFYIGSPKSQKKHYTFVPFFHTCWFLGDFLSGFEAISFPQS